MNVTTAQDVFDSFESSFADKVIIPESLEMQWLKKAIGRYSAELEVLSFDPVRAEFDSEIGQYVVDTLAMFMKQYYQEREVSRINKQISIVGKDLSIDGQGHTKTAAKNELEYIERQSNQMSFNQKPTAYD